MKIEHFQLFANKPRLLNSVPTHLAQLSSEEQANVLSVFKDWPDVQITFVFVGPNGIFIMLQTPSEKVSKVQVAITNSLNIAVWHDDLPSKITKIVNNKDKVGPAIEEMLDEYRLL